MSQSTMRPLDSADPRPPQDLVNEFNYRPVPVLAPVSLFLGVCAILSLFSLLGVAIGLLGSILGALCLRQIRRAEGGLSGKPLALIGFLLSLGFFVSGSTLHAYTIATEVPEGYRRVNFTFDISKKGFVTTNGVGDFHPEVKALNNEKIFVKGYMYPTGQTEDLTSFLLVKDNQQCCFGGQPALTDMIYVEMQDGKTVNYSQSLMAVAGVFRTQNAAEGPANLTPVYGMDAVFCEHAKSGY